MTHNPLQIKVIYNIAKLKINWGRGGKLEIMVKRKIAK